MSEISGTVKIMLQGMAVYDLAENGGRYGKLSEKRELQY